MALVILDRDGVINHDSPDYIKSVDEWRPMPGSIEAIADLCKAGHRVAVATNQSGIARGLFDHEDLMLMHERLISLVVAAGGNIELIRYCPHHPDEGCTCRKPAPGLFHTILRQLKSEPDDAFAVGDSLRDLQAAHAAGVASALVLTGNGKKTQAHPDFDAETPVYDDLAHFVRRWGKER